MVLALPVRKPTPANCIAHVASMGVETEVANFAARRSIAVVANLDGWFYLTVLDHPDRTVCAKTFPPLVANLAIPAGIQRACVNETRRIQGTILPLTAAEYPLLQLS
jgi:hypothetical protein